jgi:hypothetical protein
VVSQGRAHLRVLSLCCLTVTDCEAPDAEVDDGSLELEEEQEFRLTAVGANVLVTPAAGPGGTGGSETSAVGFSAANKLFVSFNSSTTSTSCGWSYSNNGGASFTAADDRHSPMPTFVGSNGMNLVRCLSDTWSSDASWSSGAPYVAMVAVTTHGGASQCGGNAGWRDVAMWTGAPNSFPSAAAGHVALLSDQLSSGGCTDGPKVEWDLTNHTAWVWWWNDVLVGTSLVPHVYLRPVAISSTGVITPGATIDLTGLLMVEQKHATMAIKPAAGVGMQPTIWLTYPTEVGDETLGACNNAANWVDLDITWWLSKSVDGGVTWSHLQIDYDDAWPQCLSATPKGGNRAIVSPIYDPSSDRLMLSYSRHIDDAVGNFVGTRVITKMTPDKFGNANAFTRWVPICNPAVCPNPPPTGSSCLIDGAPPVGETVCHQYGPAVGVKSSGTRRFATTFHGTRDSDGKGFPHPPVGDDTHVNPLLSDLWGYSIRSGPLAASEYTMSRVTPLGATVPWPEKATTGNLWWGDYEDGVVGFGSRFHAIWGDNRDGQTTTKLMGAAFNE